MFVLVFTIHSCFRAKIHDSKILEKLLHLHLITSTWRLLSASLYHLCRQKFVKSSYTQAGVSEQCQDLYSHWCTRSGIPGCTFDPSRPLIFLGNVAPMNSLTDRQCRSMHWVPATLLKCLGTDLKVHREAKAHREECLAQVHPQSTRATTPHTAEAPSQPQKKHQSQKFEKNIIHCNTEIQKRKETSFFEHQASKQSSKQATVL